MPVVVRTSADLAALRSGGTVALVPTMGALHDGHVQLMKHARALADTLVASIFVNPTQFAPGEDFDAYPRTMDADLERCDEAGVDVVLAPDVETVYPAGPGATVTVDPGPLGQVLEGERRPTHFRGVLTVVAKLFGLVRPDVAVFGEKDYQQLVLIRQMASELHLGVQVEGCPIVREADGLAMSSRNVYLGPEERQRAAVLSRALSAGVAAAPDGVEAVLTAARAVLDADGVAPDYLTLTDSDLGAPVPGQEARLLVAARVGTPRLLDNVGLVPHPVDPHPLENRPAGEGA
ncbi:pantoate--beta-alanine ligase [Aeromicrobium sp. CF4.19]|uniref:pantoate--beta-alanine ligase n=1 Tax=Aeromicrobium sp. CF4.19 TaxID=3373082 RepID=UPI003EE5C665